MKILIAILSILFILNIQAQGNQMKISEEARIEADFNVQFLLEKNLEKSEKNDKMPGFRIQIVSSNHRDEVAKQRDLVMKDFKSIKSYVIYDQPYYKLRLGDFRTRLEALRFMEEISPLYPSAFVVKDEIKIK
jgi:hypothetical protein